MAAQRKPPKLDVTDIGDDGVRPIIEIEGGKLPEIVDKMEAAVLVSGIEIYRQEDRIVRPVLTGVPGADGSTTWSYRLSQVTVPHMTECFTRAAIIKRFDARAKKLVSVDAPPKYAEAYLARDGSWRLLYLAGVINAPTLRPDRTLVDRPGYDPKTGLLFIPQIDFPAIASRPTRGAGLAALARLRRPLQSFPFVNPEDEAVILAAILTMLVRPSLPAAPLFITDAPAAGTGKTLLLDMAATIATGNRAPAISQGGDKEEELEKRLGASLMVGDRIVLIDNCNYPIHGAFLCQALTQPILKIRVLGLSRVVEVPGNATICASGNNVVVTGDVPRRAVICSLDAGVERPELREFDVDPVKLVREQRGELVAAGLTILLAYIAAGSPAMAVPLGSFEAWSRLIRDALLWHGAADPCATMVKSRGSDPALGRLRGVLDQWEAIFGDGVAKTAREVIREASSVEAHDPSGKLLHPDFKDLLVTIAGDRGGINTRRFGKWLHANQGRIAGGRRIVQAGHSAGLMTWRLELVKR